MDIILMYFPEMKHIGKKETEEIDQTKRLLHSKTNN